MGKGSRAPAPPDPYRTASVEAGFNRFDTYGPNGAGTRYGYTDPETGQFVQGIAPEGAQSAITTIESPWERAIRTALEPASLSLTNRIITDNIANMPDAARVGDRGTVAQSIFDRTFSMMKPGLDQQQNRLLSNLQARGMPVGSEAFSEAYGTQQREASDMVSRLAMDADVAAGQEQSRQFGLDQSQRAGAISEIVAAMGGGYNPPSSVPNGQGAGVNYGQMVGQAYQNQLANWQNSQQQRMGTASTIGGLFGSMLMKCSRDLKISGLDDVSEEMAAAVMQMPVVRWRYKTSDITGETAEHVGPMAQDFHELTGLGNPETIHIIDALGVLMAGLKSALVRIEALERAIDRETVH